MTLFYSLATILTAAVLAPSASAQLAFQSPTNLSLLGFRPDGVAVGDFDGVQGFDFAVASGDLQGQHGPNRVEIFRNQGNGAFTAGQIIFVGNDTGATALVAADLDGDGDLDLAVSLKNTNTVQMLVNNGDAFALGANVHVGGIEPAAMAAGDIDGDGDVDVVTSNRTSNNLSVLRNSGAGVFTVMGLLPVGVEPRYVALEDMNGDNRTDIAVAAHDSRRIDVLYNLGTGTFGPATSFAVPGNEKPTGMTLADLDADGDIDMVTTMENDAGVGLVVVMRNQGGTFAVASYLSSGLNPSAVVVGDFDADGDKDLATADETTSRLCVLPNLGAGTFGPALTVAVGLTPQGLAVADFDRNGSLDLVNANRDSNNVSVLLNATVGGSSTYCITTPNSGGFGTRIDSAGSLSIATNGFSLLVRGAPANAPGIFFYGNAAADIPFGNGRLCVGSAIFRLGSAFFTNATGQGSKTVDFSQAPLLRGEAAITAGSTTYFQFWHRDLLAGGSLTDTSDGLRATFLP